MKIKDMSREELIKGYIKGLTKQELKNNLKEYGITKNISKLNKAGLSKLLINEELYSSEQISFDFQIINQQDNMDVTKEENKIEYKKNDVKIEPIKYQLCLPAPKTWIGDMESDEYLEYVGKNEWRFEGLGKPKCEGWTVDQEIDLIIDRFYNMECVEYMLLDQEVFLDKNAFGIGVNFIDLLDGTTNFNVCGSYSFRDDKELYMNRQKIYMKYIEVLPIVKKRIAKRLHPDTCSDKYKDIENPMFLVKYMNMHLNTFKRELLEINQMINEKWGN